MHPLEVAAFITGCLGLLAAIATAIFAMRTATARLSHEKILELIKASLVEHSKDNDRLFDVELVRLRDELDKNRQAKEKSFDEELERLKAALKARGDIDASIIPQQNAIRAHMSKARDLIDRVYTSFNRLAGLAPSLTEDEILEQTTITLDLYAEYRSHLSSSEYISYPRGLDKQFDEFQKTLSRIFLDLQIDDQSRKDRELAAKLKSSLDTLKGQKDTIMGAIADIIRIPLPSLQ